MVKEINWIPTVKNVKDYKLLKGMLSAQKIEFDLLSKKKADGQLNPMKIKMVNRVLEPLKNLFKNEEAHEFLDTLNEDEIPTNSDVVLIIGQYETAINEFRSKYYHDYNWYTEEYLENQEESKGEYYE